jgi:hypothetical protein
LRRRNIDLDLKPQFVKKRWTVGNIVRTLPALECADFLAYERHKGFTDLHLKAKTQSRTSGWVLSEKGTNLDCLERSFKVLDGRTFEQMVRYYNVPRRPGVAEAPIPREYDAISEILEQRVVEIPRRKRNV